MKDISAELDISTLAAINELWGTVGFEPTIAGRTNQSIIQFTSSKFFKKQLARSGKDSRKKFTITLRFFEATTAAIYLRTAATIKLNTESFEFNQINNFCNHLHQQTV